MTRANVIRRPRGVALVAHRLRAELERFGIAADVHDGYGRALVSVWVDLDPVEKIVAETVTTRDHGGANRMPTGRRHG
jgi:signal transduction histidine kinase